MVNLDITNRGSKFWYRRGQLHRANGPAIQWVYGDCDWFWNGLRVSEYEHMMLSGQEFQWSP